LNAVDRDPHPVPTDAVRAVLVHIHGFHGIESAPLIVSWDDHRETVRAVDGSLRWYADGTRTAYPTGDGMVTDDRSGIYPRGNRYMDALAVRSLEDMFETVSALTIRSVGEDGVMHLHSADDDTHAMVVRSDDTGIVLRAAGLWGTTAWALNVLAMQLLESDDLLTIDDIVPPAF
jgi:hypothetical protein